MARAEGVHFWTPEGAALATIAAYEEDSLIEKARQTGNLMATMLTDLAARHPSVGAVRSMGLFGVVELVRKPEDAGTDGTFQRHVGGDGRAR